MIKETAKVRMSEDFKEEAFNIIDETINKVSKSHRKKLSRKEKNKVRNLTLDQINVNITSKANMKTLWVLNIESSIPVVIEKEKDFMMFGAFIEDPNTKRNYYKMKPNWIWTVKKENCDDGGITKEEFEEKIKTMLLEDIETAAFYGTLSLMEG